ncbi:MULTISPECIES: hypothetical protein [Ramlibacter]|uniref:Uncharacterized protein n=1 Tax=Ramlibacter pinisoli TaxID=2682844 RepID=A0A6N8IY60_9BURK|nr:MULTISPECIES: hypothetical protein [Ramlibacter]MBA2961639.1 hypothetical protein [Ramlibacter sp. CGMCC 1.13660]MVQ31582.1 hypothetical protein [Ramlibacter pinisoli]
MARAIVRRAGALLIPALLAAGCGGGGGGGTTAGSASAPLSQAAGAGGASPVSAGASTTPPASTAAGGSPAPVAGSGTATDVQVPAGAVRLAGGGWVTAAAVDEFAPGTSILVQRYDAAGAAQGAPAAANATGAAVGLVRVVALADGGFAVTWMEQDGSFATGYGYDLPLLYVQARHFDAAGQPRGAPVRVSTSPSYSYTTSIPTALAGGGYVVLWSVDTSFPNLPGFRVPSVFLRRMASDGTPTVAESFVFDTYATPVFSVTPRTDGGFTVAWRRTTPGGTTAFTREYDAQGAPLAPAQEGAFTPPG